jgi:hypothetical protein
MRKLLLAACLLPVAGAFSQNIGFGTNQPQTIIDINGDLALRSTSLEISNGTHNALNISAKFSSFRITGPSAAFTIAGMIAGSEGKLVTLFNRSGHPFSLLNEATTAAESARIITGSELALIVPHNASVLLQYVQTINRWVVRNYSAPGPWTVDENRMFTNHQGNVGIATAYPAYKLEVNGNGYFKGSNPYLALETIPQGTYLNSGGIQVSSPNTDNYPAGIEQNVVAINGNQIQAVVKNLDDPYISDYAQSLAINPLGGSVGIGTNYALGYAKLEIAVSPESRVLSMGDGTVGMVHFIGGGNRGKNGLGGYFGTSTDHPLHFYTKSQFAQMTLLQNGSLCIGTVNGATGYKLNVAGKIISEEIKVQSVAAWPDYVFKKDYHLKPIAELENEIRNLGHLPGLPDAETISREGIELGDMQTRMIEKIEELTLYIIELEKKYRTLSEKINRQSTSPLR